MFVSIVVPLYNEEENIEPLYKALKSSMDKGGRNYELIFIDDGSTDRTLRFLQQLVRKDSTVRVLSFRRNFGQTAAFAAGFDHAKGDVIVTIDGDMQNDPADIPGLLSLIGEYDIVSGWRRKRKDSFVIRRLPSMIANWLISIVTGVKLHDYGCSLKAYKADVVKNINLYGEMHRFIPAVASWYGVKIAEVETTHHQRYRGRSKYGISRTLRVVLDLITVRFLQSFSTKPLQAFGPIGLLCGLTGFIISLYLTFVKLSGQDIGGRPLLLLGILLIIVGFLLIVMGLLGEMLVRVYHESQKKPIYVLRNLADEKRS
ncbi:MAG: glycosyltransferase family 2 protein [Thermodesulfovibrionia bacterium]|nr:glycosyltransferase family 2 protein [Thermodesulfovibrionia bacterium]